MFDITVLQSKLEVAFPNSEVLIEIPRKDGEHFIVRITSSLFKDKSKVEQHRMVYDVFKEELAQGLHSLSLKLKSP